MNAFPTFSFFFTTLYFALARKVRTKRGSLPKDWGETGRDTMLRYMSPVSRKVTRRRQFFVYLK